MNRPPVNHLIRVVRLKKTFDLQNVTVAALRNVSFDVPEGQFLAILGASGSGKSTLLNQLGCLDHPTAGVYYLRGADVSLLDDDQLALLRRREIGFIFQSYNLIPQMTVLDNIAVPLLYEGYSREAARRKSAAVAKAVGIQDRLSHRPAQLSGGQQQRAAIARAIVNSPQLVLADEPTGNLDSQSSNEIMELLHLLNAQGQTVILVTHDQRLAERSDRIIRLADGLVVEDRLLGTTRPRADSPQLDGLSGFPNKRWSSWLVQKLELARTSANNLFLNILRSSLTLLGVVLGVACLVAMLAIGEGTSRQALQQIQTLGATSIIVKSSPPPSESASTSRTSRVVDFGITDEDARRLRTINTISEVVSTREFTKELRSASEAVDGTVVATVPQYLSSHRLALRSGRFLSPLDLETYSNVAVLGSNVARRLFPGRDPLNQSIKLREDYYRVIGVCRPRSSPPHGTSLGTDADNTVFVPLTTANLRIGRIQGEARAGQLSYVVTPLTELRISVYDVEHVPATANVIRDLMNRFHRTQDYEITVPLELLEQAHRTKRMFNVILGSIGAISLLVGGIGIMNISLASVTERTKEIGIRRAVGARRRDIVAQFLCESVMLCVLGGLIGLALSTGLAFGCRQFASLAGLEIPQSITIGNHSLSFRWFMAFFSAGLLGIIALLLGMRRTIRQGANRRSILASLLGVVACGLVGFVVGIGLPSLITDIVDWYFDYQVQIGMNYWSLALAFGVSVLTGIVFGTYPARRAAQLEPIDALRRE